jgi:hypothetical protein
MSSQCQAGVPQSEARARRRYSHQKGTGAMIIDAEYRALPRGPEPARWVADPDDFYEGALLGDELPLYRRARRQHGLEGEIALLRLRLHRLLGERFLAGEPDAQTLTAQVVRIVDLLVKALRAHGTGADQQQAALERALDEEAARILARAQK